MSTQGDQVDRVRTQGRVLLVVSVVTLMIGIGGLGTASSAEVEFLGTTMEAKYVYFIYFALGALCVWTGLEAKKRGFK